jgi:cytochrome c
MGQTLAPAPNDKWAPRRVHCGAMSWNTNLRLSPIPAAVMLCVVGLTATSVAAESDPAKGEKVWRKCKACHSLEAGENKLGPHLAKLFGREAGTIEGYKYSKAMRESDIVWDETSLDGYLASPRKFLKGGKMAFPGLKKEQDRKDLITFLRGLTP